MMVQQNKNNSHLITNNYLDPHTKKITRLQGLVKKSKKIFSQITNRKQKQKQQIFHNTNNNNNIPTTNNGGSSSTQQKSTTTSYPNSDDYYISEESRLPPSNHLQAPQEATTLNIDIDNYLSLDYNPNHIIFATHNI